MNLGINRDEINEAIYFGLASPSANTVLPQSPLFKEEYKNALVEILSDRELYKSLQGVGYERVQRFSWSNVAKQFDTYFKTREWLEIQ